MSDLKSENPFRFPAVDKSNLRYQLAVKDFNNRAVACSLQEDLEWMIQQCHEKKMQGLLTEHASLANEALFRNECLGVNAFLNIMDDADPVAFNSLEEMISYLKESFSEKVKTCGYAEAVSICIDRKINKVADYLTKKDSQTRNDKI